MADENWQKIRNIFDEALRRKPEERENFIREACGANDVLSSEVKSLLASLESAESFMETPAVAKVADAFESETKKLTRGKQFNHYEIVRQIGVGGMGEVYLAEDKKLDRRVAVKILNDRFSREESNLKRFVQEAKAASALNHPNILIIHEIGESENAHYIVSEWIKGETLREILRKSALNLSDILDVAIQVAGALAAAHEARLAHRDIKPENVMIRPDGFVKVLDFGLAKLIEQKNKSILGLEDATARQTETGKGVILGTINYMSPEQAKGERVDERTDIFSFGVMLYEMIAKQTPFAGDSTSETFANLLKTEPLPLSEFANNIPEELQRIVSKTLRKKKDERYQTMKDVLTDLRELRENLKAGEKIARSASSDAAATEIMRATTGDANLQTAKTQYSFSRQIEHHKREFLVGLALLIITVFAVGWWFYADRSGSGAEARQIKSIAVLPLENLSGDAAQDYFADGMTESLIGNLSQIGSLKVISRTTVMKYKKSGKSIPEIAKELGVDGIIEGSVQRAGDRFRINAQLVYAATDSPVWSKNYERSVSDVLKLESEIAQAVASEIKVQLTPEEQRQFGRTQTLNPQATEAFLLGRHYFNMWTPDSERQAVEQFQKAVELEPEYADAWAGLSDAWTVRGMVGETPIPQVEKPTRDAAIKALEIDPQNSAAHVSMCFIYNNYDFDWTRSETECKRGIELDPNNAKAHFAYAYMLAQLERWDELSEQMKTAISLDQANPWWTQVYGGYMIRAHRFEEAEKLLKRAIEIDPNWRFAYWDLSKLYVELGRFEEALAIAEKWRNNPLFMAYLYARMGNRQKALDLSKQVTSNHWTLWAEVYTALGDYDKAFADINGKLDRREGFMFGDIEYPVLDRLKSDPRWKDVARRMNLPQ